MRDFRKYLVWEQSHKLTLNIYALSKKLPNDEKFGLTSQIRRACASIPTNIAEGCGKSSDKDFARFLGISFGSASELEYLMLLVKDLDYISIEDYQLFQQEIVSIKKQLYHLINKINAV
jgi:four helix bundle protein